MKWSIQYDPSFIHNYAVQLHCNDLKWRASQSAGPSPGRQMAVAVPTPLPHSALDGRACPKSARLSSRPTRRSALVLCKKASNEAALEETKSGFVNYDTGQHSVSTQISGFRKKDIQRRYRLRVEADRFQRDWSVSEVAEKVLKLRHWEDIHGLLNRWIGRFSRKNFPLLMKV